MDDKFRSENSSESQFDLGWILKALFGVIVVALLVIFAFIFSKWEEPGRIEKWKNVNPTPPNDYSGVWIYWTPSNSKVASNYQDGILNGKVTQWWYGGKLSGVTNFKNGNTHGKMLNYNMKGIIISESSWANGKSVGYGKQFDDNGKFLNLSSSFGTSGDGIKTGTFISPNSSGDYMVESYAKGRQISKGVIDSKGFPLKGSLWEFDEKQNEMVINNYQKGERCNPPPNPAPNNP